MGTHQIPRTFVAQEGRIKKPAIPAIQTNSIADRRLVSILQPLKQNVEMLTGVRGGRVEQLDNTATLDDVIQKLNEVIARLNF